MKKKLLISILIIPSISICAQASSKIDITQSLPSQIVVKPKQDAIELLEANMNIVTENEIISEKNSKATTKSKTYSVKRGSFLMYTIDNIYFEYNGSKIIKSNGYQQAGWIFPNIAKNRGISKFSSTTSWQKWRAKNTIGAGAVTPWGDVKLYNKDYIHEYQINKNGATSKLKW